MRKFKTEKLIHPNAKTMFYHWFYSTNPNICFFFSS